MTGKPEVIGPDSQFFVCRRSTCSRC